MRIVEESWNVLVTLLPTGWQQMAWRSGAVQRLRGFPSPDVLLRVLMLHVARGYSLRETVVRAKLANWTDISDVALLKRLQNSEEWLRWLCIELFRENGGYRLEKGMSRTIRIVDGTIVRESGKTGSQWRILYNIRLPSLVCDFFEVTSTIGEGSGESLNRLPVGPHELILADAGYGSIAGIEYVWQRGADVLVRVNPQSFVAYSAYGRHFPSCRDYALYPKWGSSANGGLSFMVKVRHLRAGCVQYERATALFNRLVGDYCAKRYFPLGLPTVRRGACSPSREFSFALHQIQQAIEPHLSLQKTLCSWNQLAQALAEKSRNRLLQIAKWHPS